MSDANNRIYTSLRHWVNSIIDCVFLLCWSIRNFMLNITFVNVNFLIFFEDHNIFIFSTRIRKEVCYRCFKSCLSLIFLFKQLLKSLFSILFTRDNYLKLIKLCLNRTDKNLRTYVRVHSNVNNRIVTDTWFCNERWNHSNGGRYKVWISKLFYQCKNSVWTPSNQKRYSEEKTRLYSSS